MKSFISRLKRTRFAQLLGVFLAGCLLLISTACSGSAQAKTPDSPNSTPQTNNPAKAYDVREAAPERGMNRYSDVDPRQGETGLGAKASIDSAKRNLNRSNDVIENVKDATEDVRRDAARGARDLGNKVQNAADSATRGARDLGNKVQNAADDVSSKVQNAADDAARGARNLGNKVQNAADDATNKVQNAADDAEWSTHSTLDKARNDTENAASNLSRESQKLVNQAADRTAARAQQGKENIYGDR